MRCALRAGSGWGSGRAARGTAGQALDSRFPFVGARLEAAPPGSSAMVVQKVRRLFQGGRHLAGPLRMVDGRSGRGNRRDARAPSGRPGGLLAFGGSKSGAENVSDHWETRGGPVGWRLHAGPLPVLRRSKPFPKVPPAPFPVRPKVYSRYSLRTSRSMSSRIMGDSRMLRGRSQISHQRSRRSWKVASGWAARRASQTGTGSQSRKTASG